MISSQSKELKSLNPLAVAAQGKGSFEMLKRAGIIHSRYGLTPAKMDRIIGHFVDVLGQFNCGATFPMTAAALARTNRNIQAYQDQNIEFAVHGYYHVDHTQLSFEKQLAHFTQARQLFAEKNILCDGFRCPYLRWSDDTITAVKDAGFLYDSSQGLYWDVVEEDESEAYRRVLGFYGAVPASKYPALPRWDKGLLRIPYCLPDDEALVDRLKLKQPTAMAELWLAILSATYNHGELFTLGLHPERIHLCEVPMIETLRQARAMSPTVWITTLSQVARWWTSRMAAQVTTTTDANGTLHVNVDGPDGTVIMGRGVTFMAPTTAWDGVYEQVTGTTVSLNVSRRPFIGVSPDSHPYLTSFLRQQGYIVEPAADGQMHTLYLERPRFCYEDERALLAQIEHRDFPLVRLGRWPNGARSALTVTGDIDALTIWDYGLRFLGH